MDAQSVSLEQQLRVLEVQNLLATGIEQLLLLYFDMQLHSLLIPGSFDIGCYVCHEFHISSGPMIWDDTRDFDASGNLETVAVLLCQRCEFAIPWPCGNLRSETIADTMRFIAAGGMSWDRITFSSSQPPSSN